MFCAVVICVCYAHFGWPEMNVYVQRTLTLCNPLHYPVITNFFLYYNISACVSGRHITFSCYELSYFQNLCEKCDHKRKPAQIQISFILNALYARLVASLVSNVPIQIDIFFPFPSTGPLAIPKINSINQFSCALVKSNNEIKVLPT